MGKVNDLALQIEESKQACGRCKENEGLFEDFEYNLICQYCVQERNDWTDGK